MDSLEVFIAFSLLLFSLFFAFLKSHEELSSWINVINYFICKCYLFFFLQDGFPCYFIFRGQSWGVMNDEGVCVCLLSAGSLFFPLIYSATKYILTKHFKHRLGVGDIYLICEK